MGLWHPIDEAERTWCKLNLWLYAGIGNITESLKMPLGQRGSLSSIEDTFDLIIEILLGKGETQSSVQNCSYHTILLR